MSHRSTSAQNAEAAGNSSENGGVYDVPTPRTMMFTKVNEEASNVCDFEKRVYSECGDVRRSGWPSFRRCAEASRQSAGHANWMSDVAGQGNDRQGLPRNDQAACCGRVSDNRTVFTNRLCRFWFRRPR